MVTTGRGMASGKPATFGDRLRQLRRRAGLTQLEVSFRAGVSISNLAALEQGTRKADPRLTTIQRLARALGCEASDLIRGLAQH